MPTRSRVLFVVVALLFTLTTTAAAQDRWTIQFHGGASVVPDPGSGRTALPTPAPSVATIPGLPTRAVPSWFFGDGVSLINLVNAQLRPTLAISGLDPLLERSALAARTTAVFGVRVTRTLTPRFTLEGALTLQPGSYELHDDVRGLLDAGAADFRAFWQAAPGLRGADATAHSDSDSGSQLTSTAALRVHLAGSGGRSLYAIAGGGVRSTIGQRSAATLRGNYNLRFADNPQFAEVDNVSLLFDVDRHVPVGLIGLGWEQPVSPWAGFSFEVRSHIGPSGVSTRVTTTPERLVASSGGGVIAFGPSVNTIYISNLDFVNSSLTTALHDFRTYESSGVQAHTSITGGLFFRF